MTRTRLSPALRAGAVLAVCLALSGCQVADMVSGWFSSNGKKSDLRGVRISVLTTDDAIKPDPTIQNVQVLLPRPYRNPEWPDAGGYPSNAMYHLEASGPLQQVWSQDAGKGSDSESRVTAPPIVGGGYVFTLDSEAHVYVFRASDGQPVWNKRLAPKNGTDMPTLWGLLGKPNTVDPTTGMGGGIAYDQGKIFVTSGFGTVIAMDAATGRELWRHAMGMPIINAPVVSGGRVFFSTYDNHFYALAENDGRQLWDHQGVAEPAGMLVSSSAAVAGDMVVVPYTSGEVFALQAQNGQVNWSEVLSHTGQVTALSQIDDVAGRPVIDRDVVYAISQSGVMAAVNANSGQRMWARDIGGIQTPWAAGDYVYVLDNNDQVICLTRKEGRIRWIHQLPEWSDPDDKEDRIVWAGPVLVSNRLIVTSSNGYAESISPYTGKLLGRVEIPGPTIIAPVVANGTMYIYTADAELVALR
jgi:outer membrane protein assembly factor BamB